MTNTAADECMAGFQAAAWLTASPHEWHWSQEEQIAMAKTLLILAEREPGLVSRLRQWARRGPPR